MRRRLLALLMLFPGWALVAAEHPACQEAALSDQSFSTEELISIARSCQVPEVTELFYNRAQHRQLLQKYDRFERSLLHYGDQDHRAYIESYRIHIGLAEAFARQSLQQADKAVLRQLNRIYDQVGEIAELRFRGYDLLADRLQRKFRL